MDRRSAQAIRVTVRGAVQGIGFRAAAQHIARELGLMGWVRNAADGTVVVHAEGAPHALELLVEFLRTGPRFAAVSDIEVEPVKLEGHEQFAIRGVSAGTFVVQEHAASTHHFDLRLQLDGELRSWALPKGPSLDPAVKRLAVEVAPHGLAHEFHEDQRKIVWDRGNYEQGGRVAWPEALDRGHAVFVLHGGKLRGGFALQRTGAGKQWLLVKRRDEQARPGSDIVAEQPGSVLSDRVLGG